MADILVLGTLTADNPTSSGHVTTRAYVDAGTMKPRQIPGRYLTPAVSGAAAQTSAGTVAGTMRAIPWVVTRDYSIDQVAWELTTSGGTGSIYDLALYGSSDGYMSGDPIWSVTSQDGTAATGVKTASVSLSLTRGLHWLAFRRNASTPSPAFRGVPVGGLMAVDMLSGNTTATAWSSSSTAGSSWPTMNDTTWEAGSWLAAGFPLVGLRVS